MSLIDRNSPAGGGGQGVRPLKLSPLPNRVRVLPPGPVGSEFNPSRDCGQGGGNPQFVNRETHSQANHHERTNNWRPPAQQHIEDSRYPLAEFDSSGASSLSGGAPKNVVWNWKPRDGLVFPEGMDDALQIIPGE